MNAFTLPAQTERSVCYECLRPAALCYCDRLPELANRTRVIVVQHPRERHHPLGTARIVARGLSNSELVVAASGRLETEEAHALLPRGAALLYPGRAARDLALTPGPERPGALVVLDGTWHQARTLLRDSPALQALPLFRFEPAEPTEYRVRREPRQDYVSTVEAVVAALTLLEPETSFLPLLEPFRRMIDLHIQATTRAERRPRHRRLRASRARSLPRVLVEHFERAVLVYGEAMTLEPDGAGAEPRQLVVWTAKRLRDQRLFSAVVKLARPVSEHRWRHLGLGAAQLAQAVPLEELGRRWREFSQPDDVPLAWNASTFEGMRQLDGPVQGIVLKAAYRRFPDARAHSGSLDDVVRLEGLTFDRTPVAGRAGARLAAAEAVARHLHALATRS